jgi:DNA modification methylase
MSKKRGLKIIAKRPHLPNQKEFVDFMRARITKARLVNETNISKTKVDHWYRYDVGGFSYPSVEDWNNIKYLLDDWSEEFNRMDYALTKVIYETDDINKNANKGRLKRAVWSINTKGFKGCHYAPYPEDLIIIPIKSTCPEGEIVLDPFIGSGTTGLVAKKLNRHYIGYELNDKYILIANERIKNFNQIYEKSQI